MSDGSDGWQTLESDPGVFSELLWNLGVEGVEVEELHALDAALLAELEPIYAFIFLFKWRTAAQAPAPAGQLRAPQEPHYFAMQTIRDACGTLAVLNALLNINSPEVSLGYELANLQSFSLDLDAETRGHVLTNSQRIREAHNSFARSDPFDLQEFDPDREPADAYHFIAFVPIGPNLYELDGLKSSPISHGSIPGGRSRFVSHATTVIQDRINTYGEGELHFNLLAIVQDRIAAIERRIATLDTTQGSMIDGLAQTQATQQRAELEFAVADEHLKRRRWAFENAMRRNTHVGLAHALVVKLAEHGRLDERIETARSTRVSK